MVQLDEVEYFCHIRIEYEPINAHDMDHIHHHKNNPHTRVLLETHMLF